MSEGEIIAFLTQNGQINLSDYRIEEALGATVIMQKVNGQDFMMIIDDDNLYYACLAFIRRMDLPRDSSALRHPGSQGEGK